MIGTMHFYCIRCNQHDPAQVERIRMPTGWVIDKLLCLACGKRWRNTFQEEVIDKIRQ